LGRVAGAETVTGGRTSEIAVTAVTLCYRACIGRIRFAEERLPARWLWAVTIHLPGTLPMGSAKDLDTGKADFKAAWKALKANTTPSSSRRPTWQ
jgi:hypothetical protein